MTWIGKFTSLLTDSLNYFFRVCKSYLLAPYIIIDIKTGTIRFSRFAMFALIAYQHTARLRAAKDWNRYGMASLTHEFSTHYINKSKNSLQKKKTSDSAIKTGRKSYNLMSCNSFIFHFSTDIGLVKTVFLSERS